MRTEIIRLYEDREDVTLTTYVLADSKEMLKGKKRPAVLICPGGGYISCSDREAEPVAMAFAAMGYHAFVLRYSVYGEEAFAKGLKGIVPKKECQHPMPMREIGQAMLMIKEHTGEWLVDADRIAICGFSAGAHNCAMYETNWHKPVITDYFGRDKEMFRPAACILGYCLSDYLYMKEQTSGNLSDKTFFEASNTAFLGEAEVSAEKLAGVSPARNVSDATPPTYLWATASDELVPVQHSLRMAYALADHKVPFELHIFEEGPHGLSVSTQASAESQSQIYPDAAKWVPLVDAWLKKRFSFELPEKSAFEEMIERGMN